MGNLSKKATKSDKHRNLKPDFLKICWNTRVRKDTKAKKRFPWLQTACNLVE